MIRKVESPLDGHVRIVFELPSCVWADRIYVTGDFNSWDESAIPMRQERDGVWRASVDLPGGKRYQFRYIVDGHWQSDNHADGFAGNEYGSENSVIVAELPYKAPAGCHSDLLRESDRRQRYGSHFPRPRVQTPPVRIAPSSGAGIAAMN